MFQLETPLLELIARGTFLFILFMVLFRLLPRRTGGELAPMDLTVTFHAPKLGHLLLPGAEIAAVMISRPSRRAGRRSSG